MQLSETSTVVLFLELHQRLAAYSVGNLQDQFFQDVEQSNSKAFSELDIAFHSAFTAQAQTIMRRIAEDEDY
jgi:hypothetical protein